MNSAILLLTLVLYGAAFVIVLRSLKGDLNLPLLNSLSYLALLCHGVGTYQLLTSAQGLNLSVLGVSNLVVFIVNACIAATSLRLPVQKLYLYLFPLAFLVVGTAALLPPSATAITTLEPDLIVHILVSLAAYSALLMAAAQSILLAVQERRLREPNQELMRLIPPLETNERLLLAMLWIGLALLSASIVSGFLFLDNMFTQRVVHHTVLTSASWLLYVAFLVGRYAFGWRGMTAVRWTLCAFGLLFLGYLGSKFVIEYLIAQ